MLVSEFPHVLELLQLPYHVQSRVNLNALLRKP